MDCDSCTDNVKLTDYNIGTVFNTPYIRDFGPITVFNPVSLPDQNYNPYILFCLKSKLEITIYFMSKTYSIQFRTEEEGTGMVVKMVVRDGEEIVSFSQENRDTIQQLIDQYCSQNDNYCVLFSLKSPIDQTLKELNINIAWLSSILPFITIDNYSSYIDNSQIYVNIPPNPDYYDTNDGRTDYAYERIHKQLYDQVILKITDIYNKGGILLTLDNSQFIQDWQLTAVNDSLSDQSGIFEALWYNNDKFICNILTFLQERITGSVHIKFFLGLGTNNPRRYAIASRLLATDNSIGFFHGNYFYIESSTYQQSKILEQLVSEALLDIPSSVEVSSGISTQPNSISYFVDNNLFSCWITG